MSSFFKKKLSAFIPSESAKAQLQNVLTVEWSGHKTVLVEVPGPSKPQSNDVEMSGMGSGYGRLDDYDDEDDDRAYLTRQRPELPSRSQSEHKSLPPLPVNPFTQPEHILSFSNPYENERTRPTPLSYNSTPTYISSGGQAGKVGNPWSNWDKGHQTTSPTSSTGSRNTMSSIDAAEDPFR